MRKVIVGVFAHPDDETFGPAGTIATFAQEHDVYIICATSGEMGENHIQEKSTKTIAEIRREEVQEAAQLLGVKKVYFLGFEDGTLSNKIYHDIAGKLSDILQQLQPHILITYENRGISGHIDHITMSMVTSYVFHRLTGVQELWYYCLNQEFANRDRQEEYFIYYPPGYSNAEINYVVNTESMWDLKVEAMKLHKSQIKDAESIISHYKDLPKREHFIVVKK